MTRTAFTIAVALLCSIAAATSPPVIVVSPCEFYDQAGNVIETHEHAGDFNEP